MNRCELFRKNVYNILFDHRFVISVTWYNKVLTIRFKGFNFKTLSPVHTLLLNVFWSPLKKIRNHFYHFYHLCQKTRNAWELLNISLAILCLFFSKKFLKFFVFVSPGDVEEGVGNSHGPPSHPMNQVTFYNCDSWYSMTMGKAVKFTNFRTSVFPWMLHTKVVDFQRNIKPSNLMLIMRQIMRVKWVFYYFSSHF